MGFPAHHPKGRPGGSQRWYKPVEERVAGAEGRAPPPLRAPRRLTPSPGRVGTAGRAGGGRGEGRGGEGAGRPPPVQLQRSAAGTTPGRIPRTVTRTAQPCQRRPRSPPASAAGRTPENTPSALPTPHPPPHQGPLRPAGGRRRRRQGGIRAAAPEDGAGLPRCARKSCVRLTAEPAAPARRARVLIGTGEQGSPRRPRPGSAASLPPRRSPGAGQRRGSGVLWAWARAPPPALQPPRSPPGRQPQ